MPDGSTRTSPETFTNEEIEAAGYTPAPERPDHDSEAERVVWFDGAWIVEDLPEPPAPAPQDLSRLQFLGLLQQVGSMTDEQLVAARDDARLRAFWIKVELASSIPRADPATLEGIQALERLGYLTAPEGADTATQAIMAAWPTA